MASWPRTNSDLVRAESVANVDPVARGYAAVWETVSLECKIPTADDPHTALVHFYTSPTAETHVETWAVDVVRCTTVSAGAIPIGQTTQCVLPVSRLMSVPDRCFAFSGAASAQPATADGQPGVGLAVKPVVQGKQTLLVHAFCGSTMERVVVNFVGTLPEPTHHVAVSVPAQDASAPIHRRIPIDNETTATQSFRLGTTYRDHAVLSHSTVDGLLPGERKYVTLTLRGLGTGARYPVFVFVNDDHDKTVACHLIDVTVAALEQALE